MLEATIALLTICCVVGGLWGFFILSWTKLWRIYAAEQALTCMLQTRSRLECEKVVEKRLALLLPWSEQNQIFLSCNRRSCQAKVHDEKRRRVIP